MKIRLYGTPDEVDEGADLIRTMFDVRSVSRHYANRHPQDSVRVYVDAELLPESPLYVVPPASTRTTGGETVTAAEVNVTDRIMTSHGWQRVVRVEPPVIDDQTEVRWIYTEPNVAPFRWVFLLDTPLRRRRLLPNPKENQ